jgi:hypothetical protein
MLPMLALQSPHPNVVINSNAVAVQVVERLVKQLETKKKELSDFQEKYKIRIKVRCQSAEVSHGYGLAG